MPRVKSVRPPEPEAATVVTAPPFAPVEPVVEPVVEPIVEPVVEMERCALDAAPLNSKIVVVGADGGKKAVFATPAGELPLPNNDLARRYLPVGARVQKMQEDLFVARQLDMPNKSDLVTTSAAEACRQFVPHFHG